MKILKEKFKIQIVKNEFIIFRAICIIIPLFLVTFFFFYNLRNYKLGILFHEALIQLSYTYDYGFMPRAVMNEVIHRICDKLSLNNYYIFVHLILRYVIVSIFDVFIFNMMYKYGKVLRLKYGSVMYFIYLATVLCLTTLILPVFSYTSIDAVILILTLIAFYFVTQNKEILALPFIVLAILTHEASLFIYLPIIFSFFIFRTISANKYDKIRNYIYLTIYGLISCGLVVYLSIFAAQTHTQIQCDAALTEFLNLVSSEIPNYLNFDLLNSSYIFYQEFLGEHLVGFDATFYANKKHYLIAFILPLLIYFILLIPVFIYINSIIKYIFGKIIEKYNKIDFAKFVVIFVLQIVCTLPFYLMKLDAGRWFRSNILYYTIWFYYVSYNYDISDIIQQIKSILYKIKMKYFYDYQASICSITYLIFCLPTSVGNPSFLLTILTCVLLGY